MDSHELAHIALNAQLLSLSPNYRSAGINRYISNLLLNLAQDESRFRFTAFLSDRRFRATGRLEARVSRLPTGRPLVRILWEQCVQPWVLRRGRFDLLHGLAFALPWWSPCPSVVTIYDLSFLRYPKHFRVGNRLYLSLFVHLAAVRATHVITISQSTARDVTQLLGVEPRRITVTYCGVERDYRPLPEEIVEQFRREKNLPRRAILYLGTIEPRKNLGTLIRAYHRLLALWPGPTDGEDVPRLVVAGGKGWGWQEVFALVEDLAVKNHVLFPGFAPDAELPLWYNVAECFAYPSLYEGFGLPALEAMACGTPVITSNVSSLPEVVGEAGLTLAPQDVEGLADALWRVLSDGDLRTHLRQCGLRQAARFSWAKTARQTLDVYDQVLAHGG